LAAAPVGNNVTPFFVLEAVGGPGMASPTIKQSGDTTVFRPEDQPPPSHGATVDYVPPAALPGD
jgi:hypothetical protein